MLPGDLLHTHALTHAATTVNQWEVIPLTQLKFLPHQYQEMNDSPFIKALTEGMFLNFNPNSLVKLYSSHTESFISLQCIDAAV